MLSRNLAGRLTDRLGPRWVALAGFLAVTLATIPFGFVTGDSSYLLLLAGLLVRGFAMGIAIVPLLGASFIGLTHDEIPNASIITRVAQQVGGSVGTALLAVVLQHSSASSHGPGDSVGFSSAFWWAIAFTALATPVCLLLPACANAPRSVATRGSPATAHP